MERKRVWLVCFLGMVFLSYFSQSFAQNGTSELPGEEKAYKKIDIQYNWTIKESEPISKESLPNIKESYFLIKYQDGYPMSIEYKDAKWSGATYIFDAIYQITFSKILIEYGPGGKKSKTRIAKMSFFDNVGLPTGQVIYDWDNKAIFGRDGSIRNCTIYKYSSTVPIGFFSKEKRSFIFGEGGEALGNEVAKVSRYNMETQQLMDVSYYKQGKLVKRELYDTYNRLFTTQHLNYRSGKIKDKKIISSQGVKIESTE